MSTPRKKPRGSISAEKAVRFQRARVEGLAGCVLVGSVLRAWRHHAAEDRRAREVQDTTEAMKRYVMRREEQLELVTSQARAALHTLRLGVVIQRVTRSWLSAVAERKARDSTAAVWQRRCNVTLLDEVFGALQSFTSSVQVVRTIRAKSALVLEGRQRRDQLGITLHAWQSLMVDIPGSPLHEDRREEQLKHLTEQSSAALQIIRSWVQVQSIMHAWRAVVLERRIAMEAVAMSEQVQSTVSAHMTMIVAARAAATLETMQRSAMMGSILCAWHTSLASDHQKHASNRDCQLQWVMGRALSALEEQKLYASLLGIMQVWRSAVSERKLIEQVQAISSQVSGELRQVELALSPREARVDASAISTPGSGGGQQLAPASKLPEKTKSKEQKSVSIKGGHDLTDPKHDPYRQQLQMEARSALMLWGWAARLRLTVDKARLSWKAGCRSPKTGRGSGPAAASGSASNAGSPKGRAGRGVANLVCAVDAVHDQAVATSALALWRIAVAASVPRLPKAQKPCTPSAADAKAGAIAAP